MDTHQNVDTNGPRNHGLAYNPSIDGLRAVAVMLVVFFHTRVPAFPGGFIGVDVFFVLSGYLITSILRFEINTTGAVDLVSFYWNRALRLYPPLIMMLAVWSVLIPFQYPDLDTLRNGAIALFYLSDYVLAFGTLQGHLGHTWSLAVEEHFYMIWPLVVLATRRLSDQRLCVGLAVFFILATTWRIVDFSLWDSWQMTYHRFDTRMAGLALGATIAVLPKRFDSEIYEKVAIISLFAIIFSALTLRWGSFFALSTGMALTHIATACFLLATRNRTLFICQLLSARPLVYLGLLSYSVYLWHFPMTKVLLQHTSNETTLAIVLPASVLLAAASFELVEKPLKKFRRSRNSSRGRPVECHKAEA